MAYKFFALFDDIAILLDDVAVLTKLAAKRTAGLAVDDLALNAEQVTGVSATRELPVVWAVAKGSALNKLILVPAAVAISGLAPWAVVPLLMIGGAFLCYEGFEKIARPWLEGEGEDEARRKRLVEAIADEKVDLVAFEREKIRGAIRTDFILSAEIIVLAMGAATGAGWVELLGMLITICVVLTVGIYGLVAGIVRLDDFGLTLVQKPSAILRGLGRALVWTAPWVMKLLSVGGTIAIFLVGGGILAHGVPPIDAYSKSLEAGGGVVGFVGPMVVGGLVGLIGGALLVGAVRLVKRVVLGRP